MGLCLQILCCNMNLGLKKLLSHESFQQEQLTLDKEDKTF